MKITNFSFTLRQAVKENGCDDNYYVNIDENGMINISHPYKSISYKEEKDILHVIETGIAKYAELVHLCDFNNQQLKLEEYAPTVSSLETADILAAPQSCALGGEELSAGAEGEIGDALFEEAETGSDNA